MKTSTTSFLIALVLALLAAACGQDNSVSDLPAVAESNASQAPTSTPVPPTPVPTEADEAPEADSTEPEAPEDTSTEAESATTELGSASGDSASSDSVTSGDITTSRVISDSETAAKVASGEFITSSVTVTSWGMTETTWAVWDIFRDLSARYPASRAQDDIAQGGPCPFGPYGRLWIQGATLACSDEVALTLDMVTTYPMSQSTLLVNFETKSTEDGNVSWLEGDLNGEPVVLVEQLIDGLTIVSAQVVRADVDAEALAIELWSELEATAVERVNALSEVTLDELLENATELFVTESD